MELQGAIEATPEVGVLDRDDLAVAFPEPAARPPVVEAVLDAAADVVAAGQERDMGGMINCFQAADDGEELEAFALNRRLGIFHFDLRAAINILKSEVPVAGLLQMIRIGSE